MPDHPYSLKLELYRRAARIVGNSTRPSITASVAATVLSACANSMRPPIDWGAESLSDLADLAGAMREIISQDPDNAGRWADTLGTCLRAIEFLAGDQEGGAA